MAMMSRKAQRHRFTVKNTKAAMNAARMTMVPMPMGGIHLNFTGHNAGCRPIIR
jgi:hypothetical protein